MATMMTPHPAGKTMIDHPRITVRAGQFGTACAAQGQGCIATPVQIKQTLFTQRQPGIDRRNQWRCKPPAGFRWRLPQIDHMDLWQYRSLGPVWQMQITIAWVGTGTARIYPAFKTGVALASTTGTDSSRARNTAISRA